MKKDFQVIKEFASGEVYAQSALMAPVTITGASRSMINVKKVTGLSYKGFLFEFREDYGSIFYQVSDLERLSKKIWEKLYKDKKYLKKIREIHRKEQIESNKFYKEIDKVNLSEISDKKLILYMKRSAKAMQDAVGAGHIIEAFSLTVDDKLKTELGKYISDTNTCNQVYALLTTPEEKSFLRLVDEHLFEIFKSDYSPILIKSFMKKFFWIRSSYEGKDNVDENFIRCESKERANLHSWSLSEIKSKKAKLIQKYSIFKEMEWKLKLVSFVGAWQDDRKKFGMMGTYYLFSFLEELSKRTKIDIKYLKFLTSLEFGKVRSLKKELQSRRIHSFYAIDHKNYYIVLGQDADKISLMKKKDYDIKDGIINGSTASSGKVQGKVRVCTDIKSLNMVEEGDILVASMTRPEYMQAMKKASAFVTDEGGITCHAAIVAREMKKPCVIGTKFATKVLKNGDIVEVDGDKGTITKLG